MKYMQNVVQSEVSGRGLLLIRCGRGLLLIRLLLVPHVCCFTHASNAQHAVKCFRAPRCGDSGGDGTATCCGCRKNQKDLL